MNRVEDEFMTVISLSNNYKIIVIWPIPQVKINVLEMMEATGIVHQNDYLD